VRFEPSVRFCRAKARRVRKLQIAKPCQRISPEIRHQNWAISPVSIRHLFVRERRMRSDSWKKWSLRPAPSSLIRFACDCVPSGQSEKRKIYPQGVLQERQINGNFRFLVMLSDFYLLVKNSWLRIGDIVSLLEPLGPSEKANFLERDFWPTWLLEWRVCANVKVNE
jgi:hypothetical protein